MLLGNTGIRLGIFKMDYGRDNINADNAEIKLLLLRYSREKVSIALLLSQLGDRTFVRTGLVKGYSNKGKVP